MVKGVLYALGCPCFHVHPQRGVGTKRPKTKHPMQQNAQLQNAQSYKKPKATKGPKSKKRPNSEKL